MSFVFPNHKKEAPFQGYMGFGGGATSLTLGGGTYTRTDWPSGSIIDATGPYNFIITGTRTP